MVLAAIEHFDVDVAARFATDSRVTEAQAARDEGAAQRGIPAADSVEPMATLSGMVTEVQAAVGDGSRTGGYLTGTVVRHSRRHEVGG